MASDPAPKPQKEINRLKMQVKKLQKEKDRSFPDLGRATYQAYLDGRLNDTALIEASARLRSFDGQIEQASAEIERLRAVVEQMKAAPAVVGSCPSCGAPVTPGLRFCGSCGAPLVMQAPPAPVGSACPTCGAPLGPSARFCGECGTPMPAAAAPGPPPPPQQPATEPEPEAPKPPEPATSEAPSGPKCAACGAAVEENGAAFCGECGAKL